jgi:hypothetical protein
LRKHKSSTEALERPLRFFFTAKMYTKLATKEINFFREIREFFFLNFSRNSREGRSLVHTLSQQFTAAASLGIAIGVHHK